MRDARPDLRGRAILAGFCLSTATKVNHLKAENSQVRHNSQSRDFPELAS